MSRFHPASRVQKMLSVSSSWSLSTKLACLRHLAVVLLAGLVFHALNTECLLAVDEDSAVAEAAAAEDDASAEPEGDSDPDAESDDEGDAQQEEDRPPVDIENAPGLRGEFDDRKLMEVAFKKWFEAWCNKEGNLTDKARKTLAENPESEKTDPNDDENLLDPFADELSARHAFDEDQDKKEQKGKPQPCVAQQDFGSLVDAAGSCEMTQTAINWLERVAPEAVEYVDFAVFTAAIAEHVSLEKALDFVRSPPTATRELVTAKRGEIMSAIVERLCELDRIDEAVQVLEIGPDDESRAELVHHIAIGLLRRDRAAANHLIHTRLTSPQIPVCIRMMVVTILQSSTVQRIEISSPSHLTDYQNQKLQVNTALRFAQDAVESTTDAKPLIEDIVKALFDAERPPAPYYAAILQTCFAKHPVLTNNEVVRQLCRQRNRNGEPATSFESSLFGMLVDRLDPKKFADLDAATQIRLARILLRFNQTQQAIDLDKSAGGWQDTEGASSTQTDGAQTGGEQAGGEQADEDARSELSVQRARFYVELAEELARLTRYGESTLVNQMANDIANPGGRQLCRLRMQEAAYVSHVVAKLVSNTDADTDRLARMSERAFQELKTWEQTERDIKELNLANPERILARLRTSLMVIAHAGDPDSTKASVAIQQYLSELRQESDKLADVAALRAISLRLLDGHPEQVTIFLGDDTRPSDTRPSDTRHARDLRYEQIEKVMRFNASLTGDYQLAETIDLLGLSLVDKKRLMHVTLKRLILRGHNGVVAGLIQDRKAAFKDFRFDVTSDDEYAAVASVSGSHESLPAFELLATYWKVGKQISAMSRMREPETRALLQKIDRDPRLHVLIPRISFSNIATRRDKCEMMAGIAETLHEQKLLEQMIDQLLVHLERCGLNDLALQLALAPDRPDISSRSLRALAVSVYLGKKQISGED